ncbi:MAG: ECF-type sigma factor [Nitrosopumilaceae archaeon]
MSNEETNNQKNDITVQQKINDRRKVVYSLHLRGYTNKQIAGRLKISLSTVEKDLHEIRNSIQSWFADFYPNGIRNAFRDSFEQLDQIKRELWIKFHLEKDPKIQIRVLDSLADKITKTAFILKEREEIIHGKYIRE